MEITDFVARIQANAKNDLARKAAQVVKSKIAKNCGLDTILVSEEIFADIIKAVGLTPTIGSVYKWVRIDDLGNNSVDIQTRK